MFEKRLIPKSELEKNETQVQTTKAEMEKAELSFSRCTVTAPMSGVIRRLDAKKGLLLSVADPIARILEDWKVQIKKGLTPGDRVIVEGHRNLEEGQRVNIVRVVSGKEGHLAISWVSESSQ